MDVNADAPVPPQGWQHRNLAAILRLWAIATWLAVGAP